MTTVQAASKWSQEEKENTAFILVMYKNSFITLEEAQDYIEKIVNPCKQACTTA